MNATGPARPFAVRVDAALGAAICLLVVAVCALGGAWAAGAVPLLGGNTAAGAAAGSAAGVALVAFRKPLAAFGAAHRDALSLSALFLYVAARAAATWSELFHLGWFDWLPF